MDYFILCLIINEFYFNGITTVCHRSSKKRTKPEDGEIRDSEEDNGQPHPLVSVTKIDPDEIPEVPANKFLYRAGPTNNANQKEFRQHYGRDRIRSHRKTGRIFKGRGIFVSVCVRICCFCI